MTLSLLILPLLSAPANAGKLADGFRGIPYGPNPTFEQQQPATEPDVVCQKNPEHSAAWSCMQMIGEVPVKITYGYMHGLFFSVVVESAGYPNCTALRDTLLAAWGPSAHVSKYLKGPTDKQAWMDGEVYAMFEYNKYSYVCSVAVMHVRHYNTVQAKEAAKAAEATDDL